MAARFQYGLGWVRQLPDLRDFDLEHPQVKALLKGTSVAKVAAEAAGKPPDRVDDLRGMCSPVEDQRSLGACTAHAAVGLIEFFENKAFGKFVDASRLFVYKASRNMLHWTGDTGAYLRTAMKTLVMLGAPPEEYWPYDLDRFDEEPPAFCYSLAAAFKAVKYFRVDQPGQSPSERLQSIKQLLAARQPLMFGFTVYNSIDTCGQTGRIPPPTPADKVVGGHAVLAVGYDDALEIGKRKGALCIRNSWGEGWGEKGYGWLPYDYVTQELADDFWTVQSQEWVDTGQFA